MPPANSAQTHANTGNSFRQQSPLFLTFAICVFLIAMLLVSPSQRACNPACVVLIGDSITSRWQSLAEAKQLSGLQIISHGIPGDFTAHMVSRFDHDVIQLHPCVVVVLGGINDLAQTPLPRIEQNLASMAESAEQHGIHVVLAILLPTGEYDPDQPPAAEEMFAHDEIQTLNNWLRNFANQKHYTLLDYHSALADDRGYYLKGLTSDGVHPSAQGYERMESLLRDAIQSAMLNGR